MDRPLRLVVFTESAEGLLDLREILSRLKKLSCASDKEGAAYVLEGENLTSPKGLVLDFWSLCAKSPSLIRGN